MSYILEALKKLEQKRMQEETPGALTLLGTPESEAKKRLLWPYPVIAALLLNAGLMIWWIGPWRAEKKAPTTQPYAVQPTKLAPPILAGPNRPSQADDNKEGPPKKMGPKIPEEGSKAGQSTKLAPPILSGQNRPSPAGVNREGIQEKSVPKVLGEVSKKEVREVPLAIGEKPQSIVQPSEEAKPRPKKEATPGEKVYDLSELPSGVKSTLPEFKVSAHVYNLDRQNRMVQVNDKILSEGQELSPGLKVEQIIPGAIIFSYQGYRFRFGL
jgi:general secretion pathway protein B